MATPIQPTNTQAGCNPVSSNCVIWQGPDIPCITLCKGDSISDVTYKVATELCTLIDQLDIAGFDVSCFPPICPKPENIHDLIQFILDKLCELQNAQGGTTPEIPACPDTCVITVAPCFYYPNQFGQQVTTMTLTEYSTAIGNKVCEILDALAANDLFVKSLDKRLSDIEACDPCNPVIPATLVPTSCLTGTINTPIVTFVQTLENEVCELKDAVVGSGTIAQTVVNDVLAQQCEGLEGAAPLSQPYGAMGLIPGWVTAASGDFTTLSAAVQNLWITVCDMRTALQNVVTNCCNACNQVMLDMSNSSYDPATYTLTVDFVGSVPGTLTPTGNLFITIRDCAGVSFSYDTGSDLVTLLGTSISLDLSVTAPGTFNLGCIGSNAYMISVTNVNLMTTLSGEKCNLVFTEYVAGSAVPPLTITPVAVDQLRATFTPTYVGPVTYYLELWDNSFTGIIASTAIVNPPVAIAYNHTFGSLTTATTYQTRMTMVAGASSETGPFYPGTTL
jgi:hypothetical protein